MNRTSLTGKVAVVTGASKGIGAQIARTLASGGAPVVVNYAADLEGARHVVADIHAAGGRAIAVQADVGDPDDVRRLFEAASNAYGPVNVLVNNAGISVDSAIADVTPTAFDHVMRINVLGPLLTVQAAVENAAMDGGSIINIGSAITERPLPNSSLYTASKSALNGIGAALAQELGGRGIRVNTVLPGPVETAQLDPYDDEDRAMMASLAVLGRLGLPSDIAPIVAFLASDDSGWMTGEVICAAGGLR